MQGRLFWVKECFLPSIEDGRKSLEIRLAVAPFLSVASGDKVEFNRRGVRKTVAGIRRYSDFESMLAAENPERIAPGESRERILGELQRVYGKREQNGVLVFELK